MKINRTILQNLFETNPVFKSVDRHFQEKLVKAVESNAYNLDLVLEDRIGTDFLKYLMNFKKLLIEPFYNDLLYFLKLIATLNKRKTIYQSDLYALLKVDLPVDGWTKVVHNAFAKTMFFEFYRYLDQNSTFKDKLTTNFYNKNISEHEMDLTHEIIKWLEITTKELGKSDKKVGEFKQLNNRFYQEEIHIFYHEQLDRIVQIMNFQLRAFKLIDSY